MDSLRRQFRYTWRLYTKRFYHTRTAVLFLLIYLVFDMNYSSLENAVRMFDYPSSPWFFLSTMNNSFVCAAVGLSVVYLFSNAPYMNRNGMYQMIRCGKKRWAAAQLGSIFLSSVTFTCGIFLLGLVHQFPRVDWTLSWGKLLKTLALTDVPEQLGVMFEIPYVFMQHMEAWQAGLTALLLDSLIFTFLGFLLFSLGLFAGRLPALTVSGFFAALPFLEEVVPAHSKYVFHLFSPASWLQTASFGSKSVIFMVMPPVSVVLGILAGGILLTLILVMFALRRNRFEWSGEEE